MLRVGLSGGIGSGKSTVARRLAERGAIVIDSDTLAREVVEPGSEGLAEIVASFGSGILDSSGALDRAAMARTVFGDDAARARLNAIIHPRVGARTAELIAAAPPEAILVHDVPLLVEAGYGAGYHLVVIVDAPVEQRVQRLAGRGMDESDARARMRAQASQQQRREAADVWLDNSGPVDAVLAEVDQLWAERLVPFEANIRSRTCTPRGHTPVVAADPTWQVQARRLIPRIENAAGDRALRVDHIGSTSVPGLAAKDVIDLQLTVRSIDDADGLAEALADAGFPADGEITRDNPMQTDSAGPDPDQWVKRVHASADPGRPVNLHLRVSGRANWRYALLFVAWLRDDTQARAEYEATEWELSQRFADGDGYREANESWFDRALPRAERWAERTGWTPD